MTSTLRKRDLRRCCAEGSCPAVWARQAFVADFGHCRYAGSEAPAQFRLLTYSCWPKVLQAEIVPLSKPMLNQRIRCWDEP